MSKSYVAHCEFYESDGYLEIKRQIGGIRFTSVGGDAFSNDDKTEILLSTHEAKNLIKKLKKMIKDDSTI